MKKTRNKKSKPIGPSKFIPVDHLDKIGETAVYYGFMPVKSPAVTKPDQDAAKGIVEDDYVDDETERHDKLTLRVEEKIALIRTYIEEDWNSRSQPVMVYLKDACRNASRPPIATTSAAPKKNGYHRYADMEILGPSGPIAEATLIQVGRTMLAEEGYPDAAVEINSVGDRDSIARFSRELIAYYRKNINEMTPECRQVLKRDPFELLASHDEACKALNEKAPRAMDFLSEASRQHLEEVLEYLEALKIPYAINNGLIGNRSYCTETIFALVDNHGGNKPRQHILAIGTRYNGLAKRLEMRKDIQGVGLSLLVKGGSASLRDTLRKVKRPIASFIQLSTESKLMALDVIESLRQVKVPLYLSLGKDRLGAQVSTIEKYHTPYVIVMGKKEALDKTAIVRKTDTYSQDIVPLDKLAEYMKRVEKQHWK